MHGRRADHKFDPLDGARSSFSYMMLAKDQFARRERSCWCSGCFAARGRTNMTSDGNKLICGACTHPDKPSWVQQTVRDLGTGLAGRRKEAQGMVKMVIVSNGSPQHVAPLHCEAEGCSTEAGLRCCWWEATAQLKPCLSCCV